MNRYGERGQPCLTDLAKGKALPSMPFNFMEDETEVYKEFTHLIHFGPKPSFSKALKRKLHSILLKAFSKSRSKRTRSWLLSLAHSWAS